MTEDRQKIWSEYKGPTNRNVKRMFLDYNRYFEAEAIEDTLDAMHIDYKLLNVLDYGCGVADYGIYFARLGSKVCVYDIDEEAIKFVEYRFKNENFKVTFDGVMRNHDLIIFGEVLDHLMDPYGTIKEATDDNVKFIFTSSYPYRSDDPNDAHWRHDHHPKEALQQQTACRELLTQKYNKINYGGQRNLWIRKA